MAHADAKTREAVGFVAANGKAGRPKLPGVVEVARQLVEENAAVMVAPHFRALGYEVAVIDGRAKLVPNPAGGAKMSATFEGAVIVSEHDDLGAQIAASEKLVDRVVGKPRQATELTGAQGGPIQVEGVDVSKLSTDELGQLRELLARAGQG